MDRGISNSRLRVELEALTELDSQRFIENLPAGIVLVRPVFSGVDCEGYAIGTKGFRHSIAALYPRLDSLQKGDIVLYYREDRGTVHVGRLQEDGMVESKWGRSGPVLRHPIDMVPLSYGDRVFFRRISEEELNDLKGKSLFDLIS